MSVRRRRHWSEVLLRPQVLLSVLAVLASLSWFAAGLGRDGPEPALPALLLDAPADRLVRSDVPIVVVDRGGLERTLLVEVEAIDAELPRLEAALSAMREALLDAGDWPASVPAPRVYDYEVQRRRVVVIDVADLARGDHIGVLASVAALRSLRETAFAHGADEVEVVVDGEASVSLWGQVALR